MLIRIVKWTRSTSMQIVNSSQLEQFLEEPIVKAIAHVCIQGLSLIWEY